MKFKNVELVRGKLKFRSKLEAYCYDVLVDNGIKFSYETLIIPLLDSFEYTPTCWERVGKNYKIQRQKINKITYKPDFIGKSNLWIVETKGYFTPVARLKWKLFKQWLVQHNLSTQLFMPTNKGEVLKTVQIIKELDASQTRKQRNKSSKVLQDAAGL